jgi:hypothetical protein
LSKITVAFYEFSGIIYVAVNSEGKFKSISQQQAKQEIFFFGDVVLEYNHSMECLKRLMNERTDRLVTYVDALKTRAKKFEKAQRLKLKSPTQETFEFFGANNEEQQV